MTEYVNIGGKQVLLCDLLEWVENRDLVIVPKYATEAMIDAETDDGHGPVKVSGPYYTKIPNGGEVLYLNIPQLERLWKAMARVGAASALRPDKVTHGDGT